MWAYARVHCFEAKMAHDAEDKVDATCLTCCGAHKLANVEPPLADVVCEMTAWIDCQKLNIPDKR